MGLYLNHQWGDLFSTYDWYIKGHKCKAGLRHDYFSKPRLSGKNIWESVRIYEIGHGFVWRWQPQFQQTSLMACGYFSRVCHKHVTWRLEGISKKNQTFNPNSPDPKLFARKVHRKRLCKRDLRGPRVRFERWNGDGLLWYPCRLTIWLCYVLLKNRLPQNPMANHELIHYNG